jgi:hypothetical protein
MSGRYFQGMIDGFSQDTQFGFISFATNLGVARESFSTTETSAATRSAEHYSVGFQGLRWVSRFRRQSAAAKMGGKQLMSIFCSMIRSSATPQTIVKIPTSIDFLRAPALPASFAARAVRICTSARTTSGLISEIASVVFEKETRYSTGFENAETAKNLKPAPSNCTREERLSGWPRDCQRESQNLSR